MDNSTSPLLVSRTNSIATLTLNRPYKLNAISEELVIRLEEALHDIAADDSIKAVVIRGAGAGFMSGGDLDEFIIQPGRATAMATRFQRAIGMLVALRKPSIASLHGAVAGGGMALALACDIAVAAENIRMVFAYPKLGVSCDGGLSYRLPRLVGMRKAIEIALLDEPIGAAEALRLGLVNRVVNVDTLEMETRRIAERLIKLDPLAISETKTMFAASWGRSFNDQLNAELDSFAACAARPEFFERIAALKVRS